LLRALALTPTAAQADQTISSTSNSRVYWTSGNVTITGSGLVSVTTTAVSVGGSVGTLTNSGIISAGTGYAGISNFGESVTAINNIGVIGGGIGSGDIGTLTNTASQLIFGAGNQLLNDNVNVGSSHTVTNSAATLQLNNHIGITGNYQQNAAASLLPPTARSCLRCKRAGVMNITTPACNRAPASQPIPPAPPALRHRAPRRFPIPAYWPWASL
jgi:hypothetical protein